MSEELKFFSLKADTIAFDPKAAASALEEACFRRKQFWNVTGICENGEGDILFTLVSANGDEDEIRYVFSPFPDPSVDGIAAEIRVRFQAGMSFRGSFLRNGSVWGLYEKP